MSILALLTASDVGFVALILLIAGLLLAGCAWVGEVIGRWLARRWPDWVEEGKGPIRW